MDKNMIFPIFASGILLLGFTYVILRIYDSVAKNKKAS